MVITELKSGALWGGYILPNYEGNDYAELLPDALAEKLDELDKMR